MIHIPLTQVSQPRDRDPKLEGWKPFTPANQLTFALSSDGFAITVPNPACAFWQELRDCAAAASPAPGPAPASTLALAIIAVAAAALGRIC